MPVAEPPRPNPADAWDPPVSVVARRGQGSRDVTVKPAGYVELHGIRFQMSQQRSGHTIHAVGDETRIVFADTTTGEVLIEHTWPPKGTNYVSNGIRPGRPARTETTRQAPPIS